MLVFEQNWRLGYIIEKNEANDKIKITFLHPAGPSPLFFKQNRLIKIVQERSIIENNVLQQLMHF